MKLTLELKDDALQRKLAEIELRIGSLTPALTKLGEVFVKETRQNIEKSVDWAGRPLAPNAPTTLLFKRGNKPLKDTGQFQEHLAFTLQGASTVAIRTAKPQSAVLQFGAKKGAFGKNARGAPIPWGDIPARPFFPDDEQARQTATQILLRYLNDAMDATK